MDESLGRRVQMLEESCGEATATANRVLDMMHELARAGVAKGPCAPCVESPHRAPTERELWSLVLAGAVLGAFAVDAYYQWKEART